MLFSKRWSKEFDKLLEEIAGLWGGEVKRPKNDPQHSSFRIADAELYSYPNLRTRYGRYEVFIEISNSPMGDVVWIDGQDGVEFLKVFVLTPTKYDILIRHESLMDRLRKALRLTEETEIDNPELDARYFLSAKTGQGKTLLRRQDFQHAVRSLEPFATLRILPRCLCWSQEITEESQLQATHVQNYTERLICLTKILSELE
ncbi:MAG: hypothetical protein JSV52_03210 [Candidatus Zixiibacteriota bacterium]|nr:MAG: hypothetical protein JSV52_03210 [candidate division Zixibacteria bacterium]